MELTGSAIAPFAPRAFAAMVARRTAPAVVRHDHLPGALKLTASSQTSPCALPRTPTVTSFVTGRDAAMRQCPGTGSDRPAAKAHQGKAIRRSNCAGQLHAPGQVVIAGHAGAVRRRPWPQRREARRGQSHCR